MEMRRGKAALASRFEFPLQFARGSINGVKVAIKAAEIRRRLPKQRETR